MNQQAQVGKESALAPMGRALVVLGCGLLLLVLTGYWEAEAAPAGTTLEHALSAGLVAYANLLLIAATLVYLILLWHPSRALGRWASGLAAGAALGLVLGLTLRSAEAWLDQVAGLPLLSNLPDVVALCCALTVLAYLAMERAYRTRAAGAFVMPVVALAAVFQAWLAANDPRAAPSSSPVWRNDLIELHVLANVVAYGAFALAAALGAMLLLRLRASAAQAAPARRDGALGLDEIVALMFRSLFLGWLLFGVAMLLGALAAGQLWGGAWPHEPKVGAAALVWLFYGAGLADCLRRGRRGRRLAWWSLAGFGLTVFAALAVNLYLSVLHSYA